MALTCLPLRPLLHRSRDALSDAERLELEEHLQTCARCTADVVAIEGIRAVLGCVPARPLGEQRVARAIERAFARAGEQTLGEVAERGGERTTAPRRRIWMIATTAIVPLAAAAVLLWWAGGADSVQTPIIAPLQPASDRVIRGQVRAGGRTLTASAHIPSGTSVVSSDDATLGLGPARVELRPRTEVIWNGDTHALHLEQGHVALSVEPTPARRFRVITDAFIVEVVGTRFQVTPDRVSVIEGVVRVLDAGGTRSIAELHDGDSWAVAPPVPPAVGPAPAPMLEPVAPDESAPARHPIDSAGGRTDAGRTAARPANRETRRDTTQWLIRARAALTKGHLDDARRAARSALAASPSREQSAEARTILAECTQAAGDSAEAIRLYLVIAGRYPDLDAGQTALFAAARLEANRGRTDEARALLRRYLRAYPDGQFAADARSRLHALGKTTHY